MDKPDVDFIEGLSPAISIDQKSASRNPRSTVGTITEIYDYLRLLYARGRYPSLPQGRQPGLPPDAPADRGPGADPRRRARVPGPGARRAGPQGRVREPAPGTGAARALPAPGSTAPSTALAEVPKLARYEAHTIEVVVDRLVLRPGIERRLTDSLETALKLANGVAEVQIVPARGPEAGRHGPGRAPRPKAGHAERAPRRRPPARTAPTSGPKGRAGRRPARDPEFSQHLACPVCGTSY